jgi:hypothetical protein
MFIDEFDERTSAHMQVALERACEKLPSDQSGRHAARGFVAKGILDAARRGEKTLAALTEAGLQAAAELSGVH